MQTEEFVLCLNVTYRKHVELINNKRLHQPGCVISNLLQQAAKLLSQCHSIISLVLEEGCQLF